MTAAKTSGEEVETTSAAEATLSCVSGQCDADLERKLKKLAERKRIKEERAQRKLKHLAKTFVNQNGGKKRYATCETCKNPRGDKCSFGLCRKCCINKVFTDQVNCESKHRRIFKIIAGFVTFSDLLIICFDFEKKVMVSNFASKKIMKLTKRRRRALSLYPIIRQQFNKLQLYPFQICYVF